MRDLLATCSRLQVDIDPAIQEAAELSVVLSEIVSRINVAVANEQNTVALAQIADSVSARIEALIAKAT